MALSWSIRRQLLYYAVTAVVGIIIVAGTWKVLFTRMPTCTDGIRNGDESGIDCGGSCLLLCAAEARVPLVLWARSFNSSPSTYTAAAYVQNPNPGAGARNVRYAFQLYDDKNVLVVEREGVIDLPPVRTIPIIEPNIDIGLRTVSRTLFTFADAPTWSKIIAEEGPILRLADYELAADASRLTAKLRNDGIRDAENVVVAAVLFDADGVARAASKTLIDRVNRKSTEDIIFTWGSGVEGITRAEVTILPSF
ncbi:MAG TPA: hypothetical protein VD928_01835 [Candidatus Paceibacterota bacterium]|nr:hypothetical protein [Candidatus Paceibacterota bacterium]